MWSLLTLFGTGFKRKKNTSLAPTRGNFYKHQQAQKTWFLSGFINRKIESFQNTRCEIGLNMLISLLIWRLTLLQNRSKNRSILTILIRNRMSFVLKYTFQSFLSNLISLFEPFCNAISSKGKCVLKLCHFSMKLKCHKNILISKTFIEKWRLISE